MVEFDTGLGKFVVKLHSDKTPATVENFLKYVDSGFYDRTIFHRVIPGFVVQGGGFTQEMTQKPTADPVVNEAQQGMLNKRGTLSMARTADPHSATSQFFINLADNASLDPGPNNPGYAVFGEIVEGMEVVDKMAEQPTGNKGPYGNVPNKPIIVQWAKRR